MKLRYFYRIDHKKEPITGSNVRRKSKPGNQWKEITLACCNPDTIECTCGWRYFVQLDAFNKPVDGTLIKRKSWPKMEEGINYQEVQWQSVCCTPASAFKIIWSYDALNTTGSFIIKENGIERVNVTEDSSGEFIPIPDSLIEIEMTNDCSETVVTELYITGGHEFEELLGGVSFDHNFLFTVTQDVTVYGHLDCATG